MELPNWFCGLESLMELKLISQAFRSFPKCVSIMENLNKVIVNGSDCGRMPQNIELIPNLKEVEFATGKKLSISENLGNMKNLEKLVLYAANIKKFPAGINALSNMKYLSLSNNQLNKLPENIETTNTNMKIGNLLSICVLPERQSSGLADKLIESFQNACLTQKYKQLTLSVLSENTRAIAFYKKHQWQQKEISGNSTKFVLEL